MDRVIQVRPISASRYKKEQEERLKKLRKSLTNPIGCEDFAVILKEIRETENFIRGL